MDYLLWAELAAYVIGVLGAGLLFLELFQTPKYVTYQEQFDRYRINMTGAEMDEYTSLGRIGALLLAVAFAMLFVVRLLGA